MLLNVPNQLKLCAYLCCVFTVGMGCFVSERLAMVVLSRGQVITEFRLTFGVPRVIFCDGGREFVAEVVPHSCHGLHADIVFDPVDNPRGPGAVDVLEGWLQEFMAELGRSWPREVGGVRRIRVPHDLNQTHNIRETIILNSVQAVKRAVKRQGVKGCYRTLPSDVPFVSGSFLPIPETMIALWALRFFTLRYCPGLL